MKYLNTHVQYEGSFKVAQRLKKLFVTKYSMVGCGMFGMADLLFW